MSSVKKIAVVGDGPIGNIVIAKLLIEHHKNNIENKNNIEITHLTSERVSQNGFTRRHILFITDELVNTLENHVLDCEKCLANIANEQKLTEVDILGEKLLFSTRFLEQTLLTHITTKSNTFCNSPKCVFNSILNKTQNYESYDYVFFAIGSNAGAIRNQYFYPTNSRANIKIITPLAEPVVAFYSNLGTTARKLSEPEMSDDKKSKIQLISKAELETKGINIYDLLQFVTIIYNFYDKMQIFIDRHIYRKNEDNRNFSNYTKEFISKAENDYIIFSKLPDIIRNQIAISYTMIQKINISLDGYDNYNSFLGKFANCIAILRRLFYSSQDEDKNIIEIRDKFYNAYINFLISENMRPPTDDTSKNWYLKIINGDESIITLLNRYIDFIFETLHKVEYGVNDNNACKRRQKTCTIEEDNYQDICDIKMQLPAEYLQGNECLNYNFLVNIVPQSLDSFGIFHNKLLTYAAIKNNTKYFMIGDMANAYPAGISVEIGINFVNYIIPIFYNFYINEDKTILNCSELNIVEILDDLLSDKYSNLLKFNTNSGITLKELIENIRNNYRDNLIKLCDDSDIFLTYYNIVSLIQFIKNVDLILEEKKILAISKVFKPSNYKIIDKPIQKHIYDDKLRQIRN